VHTIAGTAADVPLEFSFGVTDAGTYTIKLEDLGAMLTPAAPLASVELGITSGATLVPLKLSSSSQASALIGAGTATFSAPGAGTYVIHVVGAAGTGTGSGGLFIQVTDSGGNPVRSFSGMLGVAGGNSGTLYSSASSPNSNTYKVTLTDLNFPQSLSSVSLTFTDTMTGQVTTLSGPGSFQALFPGASTFNVVASAQAGTAKAGLYSVTITPPAGGAPLLAQTVPVGAVTLVGSPTLTAASYALTAADLKYPGALSQLGAIVVLNGQTVAHAGPAAGGSQTFNGTAATYQVYTVAQASSGSTTLPGAGSYAVTVLPSAGGQGVNLARAVANPGSGVVAYSYDTNASSSQPYDLELADFGAAGSLYPLPFMQVVALAAQGVGPTGAPTLLNVSPAAGAGTQTVTPASGPVSLLVFAEPEATSAGLFGLNWTAGSTSTGPDFETTQGVGSLFATRTISVTSGGTYEATVADVGFPATFSSLAAFVTRGPSMAGSTHAAGSFTFSATPGNYDISVMAQPGSSTVDTAGTYSVDVAAAPSSPPVISSFSSSQGSVASGGTVMLTWSAQGADSCALNGGGLSHVSEPMSGSITSPSLTATTTFTLTCSNVAGNASMQVTVNVNAAGGKGGGGAIGGDLLAVLLASAGFAAWRRVRRA
jgi:hypothetical protein